MTVGIGVRLCSGCSGIGGERWASAFYAQEGVEPGYVALGVQGERGWAALENIVTLKRGGEIAIRRCDILYRVYRDYYQLP